MIPIAFLIIVIGILGLLLISLVMTASILLVGVIVRDLWDSWKEGKK